MTIKRDAKEKSKSQVAKKKVKRSSKSKFLNKVNLDVEDNDSEYEEKSDPIA
jgi:hypothetical protein